MTRRQQRSQYFTGCGSHSAYKTKDAARQDLILFRQRQPEFRWAVRSCRWGLDMTLHKKYEHFHVRKVGRRTAEELARVLAWRAEKARQIDAQGFVTPLGGSGRARRRRRGRKDLTGDPCMTDGLNVKDFAHAQRERIK